MRGHKLELIEKRPGATIWRIYRCPCGAVFYEKHSGDGEIRLELANRLAHQICPLSLEKDCLRD